MKMMNVLASVDALLSLLKPSNYMNNLTTVFMLLGAFIKEIMSFIWFSLLIPWFLFLYTKLIYMFKYGILLQPSTYEKQTRNMVGRRQVYIGTKKNQSKFLIL